MRYLTNCTKSDAQSIDRMTAEGEEITEQEFKAELDPGEYRKLERRFGYVDREGNQVCKDLTLASDYTTGFYRSVYRGAPCVYMEHSRTEYIFTGVEYFARFLSPTN